MKKKAKKVDPVVYLHWCLLRAKQRAVGGPGYDSPLGSLVVKIRRLRARRAQEKSSGEKTYGAFEDEPVIKGALFEAAMKGTLGEVATALEDTPTEPNPGQTTVLNAYIEVVSQTERAPLVTELENKLRETLSEDQVPLRRTIEDILKRLGLPTTRGKRGRIAAKKKYRSKAPLTTSY